MISWWRAILADLQRIRARAPIDKGGVNPFAPDEHRARPIIPAPMRRAAPTMRHFDVTQSIFPDFDINPAMPSGVKAPRRERGDDEDAFTEIYDDVVRHFWAGEETALSFDAFLIICARHKINYPHVQGRERQPLRMMEVVEGDTLSSIALRELGDASRWRELYAINFAAIREAQRRAARLGAGMVGPDWIFPGTQLIVPGPPKRPDAPTGRFRHSPDDGYESEAS